MAEDKKVRIIDDSSGNYPLKVTTLHEGDRDTAASIDVACGCGDPEHHLVISYGHNPMDEHEVEDTVEIHKVMGTVSQWRELLLPLLKDETLQEARDNLLELRELLGIGYDSLPAPDKVLRHLDRAIELTPGTGKPSTVPYPDSS